ncbi:GDSL-type esterase/lipase family protein [Paenibacillus sp. NPDC056579]|uniref:GDSL-type esterase/lipase family protein n=1 Tax=unclassified Paenibacillus TaxID=185978 RepID=UPI001EF96DFE|nr:GDSL-type esterase/lipase family protein [Paenibacillus sp. H1-7]ULL15617.1 lipase [Paenibacillus sp. H1-7]
MSTRFLWRTVGLAALLSTLLCIFGFVYAFNQIIFPKKAVNPDVAAAPQETVKPVKTSFADKEKIQIVALGDSLTAGTGDLSGRGYVGQVKEMLGKQFGKPVFVLNNFAIPGFRTYDVLKDMDAKQDIGKSIAQADLVLLTIGGNDLFEGGQGIFNGQNEEGFNPAAAAGRVPEALKRLGQILDTVAKANPNAVIAYVGLYHPFLDLDEKREGSLLIQKWNTAAFEMINKYPNMVLIPTYDLFELNLNKYLYTDHFHPNQDGYERIAERVVQVVK